MLLVGLTGNIGVGKSVVRKEMESLGAIGFDADLLAKELQEPGGPAYEGIVLAFGIEILLPDGHIDRKALAAKAFKSRQELSKLNALVHTPLRDVLTQKFAQAAKENPHGIVVLEAALIFESGTDAWLNKVIIVTANLKQQVERAGLRGMTCEEVLARIGHQLSQEEKVARADFVIDASGIEEETLRQAREVYAQLMELESHSEAGQSPEA